MIRPEATTLELQVENTWRALIEQRGTWRVFLTADGRLKHGDGEGEEVGYFTRAVSLCDFREAVFEVYAQLRRATHAR